MQLAEKQAIDRKFQKEREEKIMKDFEEKQELLGKISSQKKKSEIAASAWQP